MSITLRTADDFSPASPTPLRPLVVDLDGTLMANDMLWETASLFVSRHPGRLPQLARWLSGGKAHLKQELWTAAPIRVDRLRYHEDLISWLREEKESGRFLVLASASHIEAVEAVADHLGIFDAVHGSDGVENLKSERKAELLDALYGDTGFDYVGNSRHDLDVWCRATTSHVVSSGGRLATQAARTSTVGRTFPSPQGSARQLVKALRPHQWVKNILLFLPLLTAHQMSDMGSVVHALIAFVAFSMAASSVYLLNDIADVENDRDHPKKKLRPFAAGTTSLATGWVLWPVLAVAALAIGFAASPAFAAVLLVYLAITVAYSFLLKRKPVVDVLVLAALYTMRIVAGSVVIGVELSMWLLSFSGFFFLSLALVKRVSELYRSRSSDSVANGRGYQPQDMELLSSYGVATSVTSALVFTLFVADPETARLYANPQLLWLTVPLLLWWLMRVWLFAHRGQMNEDPILFAIRDRSSILCASAIGVVFVVATYLPV